MATIHSTLPEGGAESLPAVTPSTICPASTDNPIEVPAEQAAVRGRWIIYVYRDKESGKFYVGVTWRLLSERTTAHISQARRERRVRPGGLCARLRELNVTSATFHLHFDVFVAATASHADEARRLETEWATRLAARVPHGLNLMPPGASLGGPANAQPTTVRTSLGRRQFGSIGEALDASNRMARRRRGRTVRRSTAHARLANGWTPEEALGFEPRRDGRGVRARFLVNGVPYETLRDASTALGILIETLRSRLHRATSLSASSAGSDDPVEISLDRRANGPGRLPQLGLRHPDTGVPLSVRAYSRLTGIPPSTVLHRAHRLGVDAGPEALATPVERRRIVSLPAPDGSVITGGFREIVRRVLAPDWPRPRGARVLSHSGIRARLRRLSPSELSIPLFVRWACGQFTGNPSYDEVVAEHRYRVST